MEPRSYRLTSASTALRVSHGGFGRRPAKNMLYCASRFFRFVSSFCKSRSTSQTCCWRGWGVLAPAAGRVEEQVHERNPQRAAVRHVLAVHDDLRLVRSADDGKHVAQTVRIADAEVRALPGQLEG